MEKSTEQYIEHEVKLRVHDYKFKSMELKLNFLIGTEITGKILPVVLHLLKII